MTSIDLDRLVCKLDRDVHLALEGGASIAAQRSNPNVEIAHWLRSLLDLPDASEELGAAGLDTARLAVDLDGAIDEFQRSDGGTLTLSQNVVALAREAWLVASLQYGRGKVRVGDLLLALNAEPGLRLVARGMSPVFRNVDLKTVEAGLVATTGHEEVSAPPTSGVSQLHSGEFLSAYTQDMTADARTGRIDPVIGRDRELRQVIDVLMRRRQNNPILVGEAGVGKTAIAEALAREIVSGDVPDMLKNVQLHSLDLSLLQAGAGVKGEFERRLHGVISEVKNSPVPIILFIDEAHSLMGGGGQPGQGDAANILKPSLARGELRTIAATTWSEYKRYIEKDAALTRRFQALKVDEPDREAAIRMLRGLVPAFRAHHGVRIREDALAAAVELSARYIPERQLPDKAISLVDTTAATVALARQTLPEALKELQVERELLEAEMSALALEPVSETSARRTAAISARLDEIADEAALLEARFDKEQKLASEADRLEDTLAPNDFAPDEPDATRPEAEKGDDPAGNLATFPAHNGTAESTRAALQETEDRLAALAGDVPLVPRAVDREAIAAQVARWTGIPVGRLLSDQIDTVRTLEDRLKERVVGQDAVIARISSSMRAVRAGLSDPRRPPAVFLFVGMSGTGKTETALALADLLYGGSQYLTTINMSEFREEHKISMLLGSPPGYVGYGEGGVLTEAVRRRPYGVLLLDEIDKAHQGVQEVFYQLFDKGSLRDGEGRDVDFKNTTIVMTANTGSEILASLAADPETMPEGEALEQLLLPQLQQTFKPAFLGRTTMLPFMPLSPEALSDIVDIQIGKIRERVLAQYGASLDLTPEARTALVGGAAVSEMGARSIEAMITRNLLPALSSFFLDAVMAKQSFDHVQILHDGQNFGVVATPSTPKQFTVRSLETAVNDAAPDMERRCPDAAKPGKASAQTS